MGKNVLAEKSLDFSVRIARLSKHLTNEHHDTVLPKQLLRSGTSIGANIAEAQGAQSKADFIAKLHISLKESYETNYWIELFRRLDYLDEVGYKSIKSDAYELTKLLTTILNKIKRKP